jgi:hypothetical protein
VKLVGSGKLESRVDKGDMREKKGRLKKKPIDLKYKVILVHTLKWTIFYIGM